MSIFKFSVLLFIIIKVNTASNNIILILRFMQPFSDFKLPLGSLGGINKTIRNEKLLKVRYKTYMLFLCNDL